MNIPDKLIKDFYTNIYKSFASYFLLTDTALRCYILCDLFTSYLLRVDKKLVTITINSNKHTVVYYNGDTYDPIADAFIAPMPECGHEELLLNALKRWECSNPEHDIRPIDELSK